MQDLTGQFDPVKLPVNFFGEKRSNACHQLDHVQERWDVPQVPNQNGQLRSISETLYLLM